jgi:ribosomal protein S18 acetylase RimI-like enzyme
MASNNSIEILDLRHFTAPVLRPVLGAEGELWRQRLHWDYQNSARLLMQYLDSHMLPGYAAVEAGQVAGYAFCVYEDTKAVIGDVFALSSPSANEVSGHEFLRDEIEETLLLHLFELLVNSPQVERVESQLLVHPSGFHEDIFRRTGFQVYRRLFMARQLGVFVAAPSVDLPAGLELHPWRDDDLLPAARLIAAAYQHHPDSVINDQYRSIYGAQRFLNNIVRYAGCGTFSPVISHVVADRASGELAALVLASRVSPESGHITQLCVHPGFRRRGLARMLLSLAASCFARQGIPEVSLTVTEANTPAIDLYRAEGFDSAHAFDATVWERSRTV